MAWTRNKKINNSYSNIFNKTFGDSKKHLKITKLQDGQIAFLLPTIYVHFLVFR